jgi:xanthine dehydrogenase YagR molybdenum-binding subunit
MEPLDRRATGADHERVDAHDKVTGRARYAAEHAVDGLRHGVVVGAPMPAGRITGLVDAATRGESGVLGVVWHGNAARLGAVDDGELSVLQGADVSYAGQPVALVVATTPEAARAGAQLLRFEVEEAAHHSELSTDDPALYTPDELNAGFPAESDDGDIDVALATAAHVVDEVYTTPYLHNMPMEPHAAIARWEADGSLTLWDTTQNPSEVAATVAELFGLEPGRVVVHSEHVGGGFGSKGTTRPHAVLAALGARAVGAPVRVVLGRDQLFHLVGYRTPTIQRVRLGADADGRLLAIGHDTIEQTSYVHEFAEQTGEPTRHMYAAPNRRITHRLARLNVPTPRWVRAPGEAPGMYAVETAMDELAVVSGIDPVELRIRNDPSVDPESGHGFSSRHYVACLREGARRFGWHDARPAADGPWRHGRGVAGSMYPAYLQPSSARVTVNGDGTYTVEIAAADIGTGARTVLRQIAADALDVPVARIDVRLGDSSLPQASGAGGSSGTASWGFAVTRAARELRRASAELDGIPPGGATATADTSDDVEARSELARFAFGAQFVAVRVHADTCEIRVDRALGVFAVGTVVNPRLARSQLLGGMTMGLSMGLLEEGIVDPTFGDTVNDDLAEYHIAVNADVAGLEVAWLDERDDELNPMGSKGIGEIGIVGTAAALVNAVFDATGVRVRELPIRLERLLEPAPD